MVALPASRSLLWVLKAYGTTLVGAAVWIAAMAVLRPPLSEPLWVQSLLMLAPLVLIPLGLRLMPEVPKSGWPRQVWRTVILGHLPAALLLGWSYLRPQGLVAAILALPWLAITGMLALIGLERLWRYGLRAPDALCIDASLVYVVIGAIWVVCDRLGVRPLNLGSMIVLLTAVHFHYAGFILPLLTGCAGRQINGYMAHLAGSGVILSVPLVAMGITSTQLAFKPWIECLAALCMATSGILTAILYLRLARRRSAGAWPSCLWRIAALSLLLGMAFAVLYGLRFYFPVPVLTISHMQMVHGTANAIGFGGSGMLAWTLARLQEDMP